MRTDDLIDTLAADAGPAPGGAPAKRLLIVAALGAVVALTLVLAWLGVRSDLHAAMLGPFFWVKAVYTALLAVAGFWACERLSRPTETGRRTFWLVGAVLILFVGAGIIQMMLAEPYQRMGLVKGHSIAHCLRNILVLGTPMLVLALVVLRGLAPARPTLAGFAAGLFSGSVCATVYGLHCAESTMVFVGFWYTLGVLLVAGLGAVLGRWVLRW
ncbi:MAG: DUF1109 domain-containing protein [Alphaproteobacteria bacterium]|nr:DUF1109 domain-containing protein [Alphaproteobacteria bacterium]